MKISKVIKRLEEIKAKEGNVEIESICIEEPRDIFIYFKNKCGFTLD